jgi:uncharacterized Fe-S cluster-containing MiaB family protein
MIWKYNKLLIWREPGYFLTANIFARFVVLHSGGCKYYCVLGCNFMQCSTNPSSGQKNEDSNSRLYQRLTNL